MAGTKFDESTTKATQAKKKAAAKRDKSDRTMHFKKVELSLYNGPDAHIVEGKRKRRGAGSDGGSKCPSERSDLRTASRDMESVQEQPNSDVEKEKEIRKQAKLQAKREARKYELFVGRKGEEEFMQALEEKVKAQKPSIDLSEICDQFYNRREGNGIPVASMMQVFR